MPLSWNEIRDRAFAFSKEWADAHDEASHAKPFWIGFFEIFGITDKRVATFEHAVRKFGGAHGRADLFWRGKLLVEQKSRGKDLDAAFDQAMAYLDGIAERDLPRVVIVCDFARFRVHNLKTGKQTEFPIGRLRDHIKLFGFIAGYETQTIEPQSPVNREAAERMGKLHDLLKASGYVDHPLELLLVRLLFCLFADDTGIFQPAQAFRDWLEARTAEDGSDLGNQLAMLFQVLNSPEQARQRTLDDQLAAFPFVNGRLFEEALPIASFDRRMRETLIDCCTLDWSAISPAIFGALFQSIMDAKARRNLGAHYTSEENILKLIKPLFLDDLWEEFGKVKGNRNRLFEFHKKLRTLNFLDPACGCGNFLVIAYRELRRLELEILRATRADAKSAALLDLHSYISVDVDQFYGIEIEEFPAQIAQVALWLVDHQMNLAISEEFGLYFARIPLVSTPHIHHGREKGNALRIGWSDVLPAGRCAYILGNPPFVGSKLLDDTQRKDMQAVFADVPKSGTLDFVAAWYKLAAEYMKGTSIRAAFVSTNSICQGEQPGILWGWLLGQGIHITFAHRTFRWDNEGRGVAAVHCVIVGFSYVNPSRRVIFEYDDVRGDPHATVASNINPYLVDAPDVALPSRSSAIGSVPEIVFGNMPNDGGHLLLSAPEMRDLVAHDPNVGKLIRQFLGADEFINGIERYCLWLAGATPEDVRGSAEVVRRLGEVRKYRLASKRAATQGLAALPGRFGEVRQPQHTYVLIPRHSSERRQFVPVGFVEPEVIVGDANFCIPKATVFHFGILSSTMHNAWIRYTCGRLKSDFRYSKDIVYNNFPWPESTTAAQRHKIEAAAQGVLDARSAHQGASLADLYDPVTMPVDLVKAHQALDAAVDAAYVAGTARKAFRSDAERVAFLFELYQRYTSLLPMASKPKARRARPVGNPAAH